MYRKIMVAVDGSSTAQAALEEAIKLTIDQGATLRLVHVVDEGPASFNADAPFPLEDLERALRKAGEQILDKALATVRAAGLDAQTLLIPVAPIPRRASDALAAEATRWPADLIVIGTHGRHGFAHLLLGSVAEGVIRAARQPVLLIKAS